MNFQAITRELEKTNFNNSEKTRFTEGAKFASETIGKEITAFLEARKGTEVTQELISEIRGIICM